MNTKLSERLVTMERRFYANEQYSSRECLEISVIPVSVADNGLESKVWKFQKKLTSQSTLALSRIVIVYTPKTRQRKSS